MRRLRIVIPLAVLSAAVIAAGAAAFGFKDPPPPSGTVGQPYSYQWVHDGIGPSYEYTYTLDSGVLPPGLNLSSSGLLSGTPTQAGLFNFYIAVTYTCCGDSTVKGPYQERISISIIEGLAIQQSSLPTMVTGAPFSAQLTASGGGTQTWSVSEGTLPTGLTLSSGGLLSGTPTTPGTFAFTVRVTDGSRTDTQAFGVEVIQALALAAPAFPPAVVGSDFAATLTASGGKPPYVWTIKEGGAAWPRGLSFKDGAISGRPRVAGTYNFTVVVTDTLGNVSELPLTLLVNPRLKIPLQTVKQGRVGKAYRNLIVAKGGATPRTFELADGDLPRGLRLNARTGLLVGKPRTKGRFVFTVVVADQIGNTHQRRFVLRVR
jgi:hypothetical protein